MKRLFFALPCSASTRLAVLDWREECLKRLRHHWVPEENLHMTLAFIGGVEDDRIDTLFTLGDAIQGQSFELKLNRVGQFGRGKYVWLGPSRPPRELSNLVGSLNRHLTDQDFPVDQRPYIPHLTLAKKAPHVSLPEAPTGIEMNVTSFALYESVPVVKGVRYDVLKSWPLNS